MIAIDSAVLVTIIGTPAALIAAVGTVWAVSRTGGSPAGSRDTVVAPPAATTSALPTSVPTNGHRFVTHSELREVVADIKDEMQRGEERQNSKLDLIVTLLRER